MEERLLALEKLDQGRVRWTRVLNQLCEGTPDETWFRSFNIGSDTSAAAALAAPGGKRFQIALTGYAVGTTPKDMDNKLTQLLDQLSEKFGAPGDRPEQEGGPMPAPKLDPFLRLKFDRPRILSYNRIDIPKGGDPKAFYPPKGLDFSLTISFELPSMDQPGT